MKVYVAEVGSYSDKYDVGVFSSKEKAEEYLKTHQPAYYPSDHSVTEWELDKGEE